jgi:hypothetical protein
MNKSCGTLIPHADAVNLIGKYKLRVSDKASVLKKRTNLKHTNALDEVCKREGYKDYYTFKKIINTLLERAAILGKQEQRINCATIEVPDLNSKYYLFNGGLVLEPELSNPSESILTPMNYSSSRTRWTGWLDESNQIELRVAIPVDPHLQIEIYREILDKQIYVINNKEDFFLWFHTWGGDALIEEDIVINDEFLSSWLEPHHKNFSEGV